MHHSVDDHRIDDIADVVDGNVAENLHLAGVALHLDHGDMRAERIGEVARIIEGICLQSRLEILGIVVREIRGE